MNKDIITNINNDKDDHINDDIDYNMNDNINNNINNDMEDDNSKLSFHEIISKKITYLLDILYYNNLKKLYKDTLSNIFTYKKIPVIEPEYFIFLQYYFIYTFFYYISNKNFLLYSSSLHLTYISGLLFDNLLIKYNYNPSKNIFFFKK